MNAGATAERVYDELKARIMDREFRPGGRLDPAIIAGSLAASVTPVRDALNRLTGEGLVETATGGGFHLPALDEPALKDLYDWSADLLGLALRHRRKGFTAASSGSAQPTAIGTAQLFLAIGRSSTNLEHMRAIGQLNARLHAIRTVESTILDGAAAEIATLDLAWAKSDFIQLKHGIATYHRRRCRLAADIVRAVYRD